MIQRNLLSIWLIFSLVIIILLLANCYREPIAGTPSPTPTPLPAGNIFFEPSRVSAETRAIEVEIVNLVRQRAPVVEHSIVITEPTTIREITTTLLAAVSTTCAAALPTRQQESGYGINLYLYSQSGILPQSATRGQWMLAVIYFYHEADYISFYQPDGLGGRIAKFCPVGTALREILEHELALRGLTFPR
jgi:hypothetical protein